jgi:hypothetical protein
MCKRIIINSIFVISALVWGVANGASIKDVTSVSDRVPITASTFVHGLALDAKGLPIRLTPDVILQTQKTYIQRLEQLIKTDQQEKFKQKRNEIFGSGALSEADQVWGNALWVAWMLDNIKPDDLDTVRAKNYVLLSRYASQTGKPIDVEELANGRLTNQPLNENLQKVLIDIFNLLFPPDNRKYLADCRASGVPTPPPWNSPEWKKEPNPLTISYLTPSSEYPNRLTEIYSYQSAKPKGLCIALSVAHDPVASPNTLNALGVICQSVSTVRSKAISNSKACFWDNNGDITKPAAGQTYSITSWRFLAPPHLPDDNRCSDCHAGENAFIIHPGQPTDNAKNAFNTANPLNNFTTRNNWYKPLVQNNWPQNPQPAPYKTGNKRCTSCHISNIAGRLPNVIGGRGLSKNNLYKYCGFILPNVLTDAVRDTFPGTMSVHKPGNAVPGYADSVSALYANCKSLPHNPGTFPVDVTPFNTWLSPVYPVPPSPPYH